MEAEKVQFLLLFKSVLGLVPKGLTVQETSKISFERKVPPPTPKYESLSSTKDQTPTNPKPMVKQSLSKDPYPFLEGTMATNCWII
jgi:hypothetical protein